MTREPSQPDDAQRPLRVFVALPVPAASAQRIHDALAVYRRRFPEVRWMAPEQYHVTLRFLGLVGVDRVAAVEDAVRRCADGGRRTPITVGRGGGTTRRSEVAWLELAEGADPVIAIADRLDALLPVDVLGERPRARPRPHLTIARRVPEALLEALRDGRLGTIDEAWSADRLVLYRSFTGTPTGSRYEVLAEERLGDPGAHPGVPQPTHRGAA